MKQVKIYTYTTIKGPAKQSGGIGYLMQTMTSKGAVELSNTEVVTDCNGSKAALLAVLAALRRLRQPCSLVVYTDSDYVANGIEGDAERWQQSGWKNARGKDTANREEWEECLRILQDKQIEVRRGEKHEFYSWLQTETKRKAERSESN